MSNSDKESPDIVAETPLREIGEQLLRLSDLREWGEQPVTSLRERDPDLACHLEFKGEERRTDLIESPAVEREGETSLRNLETSVMTSTSPTLLPTVHGSATEMFKST